MKNRAKCALCKEIIESFHEHDYVACGCGEISVVGGSVFAGCGAKDWANFLRVDDDGNEFKPKVIEKGEILEAPAQQISLQDHVEAMIKALEALPQSAMTTPITHFDFHSILLLLRRMIKDSSHNNG